MMSNHKSSACRGAHTSKKLHEITAYNGISGGDEQAHYTTFTGFLGMPTDPSITKLRVPKRFSVGGADPVKNWDTRALEFAPTDTLINTGLKTLKKTPWDYGVDPPERKTSLK